MLHLKDVIIQEFSYNFFITLIAALSLSSAEGHVLEFAIEPSDTVVENGQSAVLDCMVKPSQHQSSVLIQWLDKDRQKLSYLGDAFRSQLTNGSLYINSVKEEEGLTGFYRCMATLPHFGSIVSRMAKLKVANLFGFYEEPRDIKVFLGQKAFFACGISAEPPPKIKWLKDERPFHLDELRMTVLPSGALEIDEVSKIDQGTYRCNASSLNSYKLSNRATLTIDENTERKNQLMAPTFIAKPRKQKVVQGQELTLDCAVNGNPKPTITWLKNGVSIDMKYLDSRYSLVGSTSCLSISDLQESDGGSYQCRAQNSEDIEDAVAALDIQVPPKFKIVPRDVIEFENKDIQLNCSVYGKPEPKIEWLKDGEPITPNEYYQIWNGHLKIMGLIINDSGLIQCCASNSVGSIQAAAYVKVLHSERSSENIAHIGPPQDLKAIVVKARFAILSWKAPNFNAHEIEGYSIYYRQEGSGRERNQNTTRSKLEEINIGGLTPGKIYHFRVVPFGARAFGISSELLTITTQAEERVPSQPSQFEAYATGPRSIYASWKPPVNPVGIIEKYKVYYMETKSSEEHNIDTSDLQWEFNNLEIFSEYSIWIIAVNQNGPGAATEEKLVRTLGDVPSEPPSNITIEYTSTRLIVRWHPPPLEFRNGVITGYKLKKKKLGSRKPHIFSTLANEQMLVFSDSEKDAIYQIKLAAMNANGTGPFSEWLTAETFDNELDENRVPDKPGPLEVRSFSDKVLVKWTPPNNHNIKIRNYILGWGKGVSDIFTQELGEKTLSYVIERLEPNSEYVISVRASNQMGAGNPAYAYVRTQEEPPPEPQQPLIPPVGLKALVWNTTSIVLYWIDTTLSKSQGIKDNRYYVVKYSTGRSLRAKHLNVTGLNVMINDLKPNTLYEFSVKLVKGRKESPWSMVVTNTTWDIPPNAVPRDVDVHFVDDQSQTVELTWQPPKNPGARITGYIIFYTDNSARSDREWSVTAIKDDKHSSIITDLKPLTEYYFKIQARNSRGYGPFSPVVRFKTGRIQPGRSSKGQVFDSQTMFTGNSLLYMVITGCVIAITTVTVVTIFLCCRKKDSISSPDRSKKGYQKGNQNIKPPDLWIHHDQMELKNLEKRNSSNDAVSSNGTLNPSKNTEYEPQEILSSSFDRRTYVPNYVGMAPMNAVDANQSVSESIPGSRSTYSRTQYSMPRAHIIVDPIHNNSSISIDSSYASHPANLFAELNPCPYISKPLPIAEISVGSGCTTVLSTSLPEPSQDEKVSQLQNHPLKSFTVPAPPLISTPGTPQSKHPGSQSQVTIRPSSSPFKKLSSTSQSVTTPSRISASNPPSHTPEEIQGLQPSYSTEELNQEMANLEGLMLTLNAITANEFEC